MKNTIWKHLKRGTRYSVIGTGKVHWLMPDQDRPEKFREVGRAKLQWDGEHFDMMAVAVFANTQDAAMSDLIVISASGQVFEHNRGAEVVIYASVDNPAEIWVRRRDEFLDGRFEAQR